MTDLTDAQRLAVRIGDTADRIRVARAGTLDEPVVRVALHRLDDVVGDAIAVTACEPADSRPAS